MGKTDGMTSRRLRAVCSMGVPCRVSGGRRCLKKFVMWAVIVGSLAYLWVKDIRDSLYESPEDGKKETREMMDGNDDGKMMGGADNENESEIEIDERRETENQYLISDIPEQLEDGDGDGDDNDDGERHGENNDAHIDDKDKNEKGNGDDDNNEEGNRNSENGKNNHEIDQMIVINGVESETKNNENPRETKLENKQEKDKDEKEKYDNQEGEAVVVNELQPNQGKIIDKPEIENKNGGENYNRAGEENDERGKEKENEKNEGRRDEEKRVEGGGGGGGGSEGGNEKKEEEGKDREKGEERREIKEKEEGRNGEEEINKEDERKDAGKEEGVEEEKDVKETENKGKEEEKKEEGRKARPWKSSVLLNGNLDLNESLRGKPVVKVLLLAYQRSGSSFTGELLSSGGSAFYVYEPLFMWRHQFHYAPDPAFHQDISKLLGDLLDCSPKVLNKWQTGNFKYFRRKPVGAKNFCKDASFRLVKTIRAGKSHVLPWLLLRQDIKLVHLVRDPRGILNSVSHGGNMWTDRNRDAVYQCTTLREDLGLEQLGPKRYLRVRYEDLVDNPLEETMRIFSFMGIPVNSSVLSFLKTHTGINTDSQLKQKYLNTFRQADFHHDHWKKELDGAHIRQIEDVCREVMSLLHYSALPRP